MPRLRQYAVAANLLAIAILAGSGLQGAAAIDVSTLPKEYKTFSGCYSASQVSPINQVDYRYELCFWDQLTQYRVSDGGKEGVTGRFGAATYDATTRKLRLPNGDVGCTPSNIVRVSYVAITLLACGAQPTVSVAELTPCVYEFKMGIPFCAPPPPPRVSVDDDAVSIGVGVGLGVGLPLVFAIVWCCVVLARRRIKDSDSDTSEKAFILTV